MDWSTVALGAGVSALVSAIVSVVAVRSVTVRRARAERAEAARLAVRELVEPMLEELTRYEYVGHTNSKRQGALTSLDDHTKLVKIKSAAAGLRWWRRVLVRRRCQRVFGRYWVDMTEDFPATDSTLTFLASALKDDQVRDGQTPVDGLLHRAFSQPAGGAVQKELRRELRMLARSL